MRNLFVPGRATCGFPVTGPMDPTGTSGFPARGCWFPNRGCSGLRGTGDLAKGCMSGTQATGDQESASTAALTTASATLASVLPAATGAAGITITTAP